MTVYVDDMRAPYGRMKMCHMLADTEEELHAMADAIGVARRWYQRRHEHYDIALSKRQLAIEHGALPITLRELAAMSRDRRILRALVFQACRNTLENGFELDGDNDAEAADMLDTDSELEAYGQAHPDAKIKIARLIAEFKKGGE
jgi:hypothetical protein